MNKPRNAGPQQPPGAPRATCSCDPRWIGHAEKCPRGNQVAWLVRLGKPIVVLDTKVWWS